jgi:hypothetical protein
MNAMSRKPFRLRLSVRTLLVFVLVIGLALGLLARRVNQARQQSRAVAEIRGCGGSVEFDWQQSNEEDDPLNPTRRPTPTPSGPAWLRRLVGDDYFQTVTAVDLSGLMTSQRGCSSLEVAVQMARSFPQLKFLLLDCRGSCEDTLEAIGELNQLEKLIFWGNDVTDAGMAHLRRLTNLKKLWFSGVASNWNDPMTFHGSPYVTDDALKHLSALPRLEFLDIQGDRFTDKGLAYLTNSPSLKQLTITAYSKRITDGGLLHLQRLPRLEVLSLTLDGTNITLKGLGHLETVKDLSHLNITGGTIKPADLDRLQKRFPNLSITLNSVYLNW